MLYTCIMLCVRASVFMLRAHASISCVHARVNSKHTHPTFFAPWLFTHTISRIPSGLNSDTQKMWHNEPLTAGGIAVTPPEVCKKLDIRHVTLLGTWAMSKVDEDKMHKHFRGNILHRHSHNEFYTVHDWNIVQEYLQEYTQIEIPPFHPPMKIPKPNYHKKRDVCCGGTALFCVACQRPIKKEWKRHLGTKMHTWNTRK